MYSSPKNAKLELRSYVDAPKSSPPVSYLAEAQEPPSDPSAHAQVEPSSGCSSLYPSAETSLVVQDPPLMARWPKSIFGGSFAFVKIWVSLCQARVEGVWEAVAA